MDGFVKPMLARSKDELPEGSGWIYEPKWDGFRAIVVRSKDGVELFSRDGRNLVRYFPELVSALTGAVAEDAVVDGEIVVASPGGLEFETLQQRIHPAASRVAMLAETTPASFIAFDLIAAGDEDLMNETLEVRLARLPGVLGREVPKPKDPAAALRSLGRKGPIVSTTPRTESPDEARSWIITYEDLGLDGVVAKNLGHPYRPGARDMVKVKRVRTADCVVGGYRVAKDGKGVGSLLLGFYDDAGILQYVGHTSGFKAAERVARRDRLQPLEGGKSFGGGRSPGGERRWSGGRDSSGVPLAPSLVCEVSDDRMLGGRFRHAVGFVRWRPDKPPDECTFAQVS